MYPAFCTVRVEYGGAVLLSNRTVVLKYVSFHVVANIGDALSHRYLSSAGFLHINLVIYTSLPNMHQKPIIVHGVGQTVKLTLLWECTTAPSL
jgi:hypothetical protein